MRHILAHHLGGDGIVRVSYRWERKDKNVVGRVLHLGPEFVVIQTTRDPVRTHCIRLAELVATSDRSDPHAAGNSRPDNARA